jgi:hypothetical protein
MVTTPATSTELLHNRNRMVAKSFYRQLRTEGFSHVQVIELSAALLDLVNDDLKEADPVETVPETATSA